jgi:outer membrane protein assembly factor BamA
MLLLLGPALAAAAPGSPKAPQDVSCTVPPAAGTPYPTVTLVLAGMSWPQWPSKCPDLARYLLLTPLPVEEDEVRENERLFVETGYFKAAACTAADDGDRLVCKLSPADIVRDVTIAGKVPFALLEEDVRRRIFLRPGVQLGDGGPDVELQARRLRDYLVDEGYFDSHARVRAYPVPGAEPNRGVEVVAALTPGERAWLRHIEVQGDQVLPMSKVDAEFRHRGFLFIGTVRFQPGQFRQDLTRLADLYHGSGWPEARVDGDYRLDLPAAAVDVVLRVDAGPKLILRFTGNHASSDHDLAAVATFKTAGIIDQVEMDNTAAAIVTEYQKKGFYAATATYTTEDRDHARTITYAITEGPHADIAEVVFRGNTGLSESALRNRNELATLASGWFFAGRWVDTYVANDIDALQSFYREHGFADVRIRAEREVGADGRLRAVFTITEGPQRRVAAVTVEGLPPGTSRDSILRTLRLHETAPFAPTALDGDREQILAELGAAGYIYADAKQQVINLGTNDLGDVEIRYSILSGPRTYFGGAFIRGNFRTRPTVIAGALGLRPGDPLNLVAVGRARRRLRDLGIFASVELRPLGAWLERPDTWLAAAVQERNARSLDAVLSFATDDLFSIGADYQDANVFGRAVRFDSQARLSNASEPLGAGCGGPPTTNTSGVSLRCGRIGNRDFVQLVLRAPRPFELPADLESTAFYDYQDKPVYRERRVAVTVGAVRAIEQPDLTLAWGYELVSTYFFAREPIALPPQLGPNASVGRIVPRLALDHRDSFADPRHGYRWDFRFEMAHRLLAAPLPDAASFLRTFTSFSIYAPLFRLGHHRLEGGEILGGPVVFAFAATAGAAEPWAGATSIPDSEAFYYGGDLSVRGLPERASITILPQARYLLTATTELRWYVWQGVGIGTFQLAPFADYGTVALRPAGLGGDATLSAGGALRYVTPVGPVSLAYAKPLILPPGLPTGGRIHFSFGYTF